MDKEVVLKDASERNGTVTAGAGPSRADKEAELPFSILKHNTSYDNAINEVGLSPSLPAKRKRKTP